MKKILFLVLAVLLVSVLLAASCSSTATTPTTTFTRTTPTSTTTTTTGSTTFTTTTPTTTTTTKDTTTTTTETTTTTTTQNVAVIIQDFAFSPSSVTITVGSTVIWQNHDSTSHTVTSDTGLFNSGTLSNGGTFSFTFNTPGTYNYHCSIHSSMHGTIIVN